MAVPFGANGGDSMSEMKFIVDALNAHPFKMSLTLVGFSHKNGNELLQIVNDVFTDLDPAQKRDVRDEAPDQTAIRMLDFLNVCKYQIDDLAEFKEQFMRANPEVIYPLLYWLMQQLPNLKKRAYLARYLRPVDIPEEFFADAGLLEQLKKFKESQEIFKETHKAADKSRLTAMNPSDLQAEIDQLEQEKTQLQNKLQKLRERVQSPEYVTAKFGAILDVTHKLRKQQEEEQNLSKSLKEQKQRLQQMMATCQQKQQQYEELKHSDDRKQNPQQMLAKLRDDVKASRFLCNEKLEKDIKEREGQWREMSKLFVQSPMTEDQVEEAERDVNELTRQVNELTAKRDSMAAQSDSKMHVFRSQAAGVEKKKEKLLEQVRELEEDKKEADNELRKVTEELEKLKATGLKPKSDAEKKQINATLNEKLKLFTAYKAELSDLRKENDILIRTEEVLRSRDANIAEFNAKLEAEKGVQGFAAAQDQLETVSASTGKTDIVKTETLDEISKIVEKIKASILEKHNKLKPQIVEFKSQRAKADDIEAEYQKKKRAYENTVLSLNAERLTLEKEVEQNSALLKEEETSYHYLNGMATITTARQQLLKEENSYLAGKGQLSAEFKTYQDLINKSIRDHDALSKKLHRDQKDVKESHESNVDRRKMFVHLKTLMQCKLKLSQQEKIANRNAILAGVAGAGGGGSLLMGGGGGGGADGENFLRLGMDADNIGGGDRMVIND